MSGRQENLEIVRSLLDYAAEYCAMEREDLLVFLINMAREELNTHVEELPQPTEAGDVSLV